MTTAPDNSDEYPDAWKPRERIERDSRIEEPVVESWLASLPEREFQALILRTRGRG